MIVPLADELAPTTEYAGTVLVGLDSLVQPSERRLDADPRGRRWGAPLDGLRERTVAHDYGQAGLASRRLGRAIGGGQLMTAISVSWRFMKQ